MPTQQVQEAVGYAFCVKPQCPGNNQVEVPSLREETFHTFKDLGGDWEFIERSQVRHRFADEEDSACPHCGAARELTDQPRPSYAPLSGHDPNGLLDIKAQGIEFDPQRQRELAQQPMSDAERDQMREENSALRESIARLEGQMTGLLAALGGQDSETETVNGSDS